MALVNMVKAGDQDAFGELWKRHAGAVAAAARSFTGFDPDDVTQETFYRVLKRLEEGHGPTTAFRAYAIMTARNVAVNMARQSGLEHPTGVSDEALEAITPPRDDFAPQFLESSFTLSVFQTLPVRWQEALWYREVEDLPVQVFCTFLGMSENATSALLKRAREGFKQAWLAANISPDSDLAPECRWAIQHLPRYVRGKAPESVRNRMRRHLATCPRCAIVAEESDALHRKLALVLLPALLGGTAGASYLDWARSSGAAAGQAAPTGAARWSTAAKVAKFGLIPTAAVIAGSLGGVYALSLIPTVPDTPRTPPASSTSATAAATLAPTAAATPRPTTTPARATAEETAVHETDTTKTSTPRTAPTPPTPTPTPEQPAPVPQPGPVRVSPLYVPSTITASPADGLESGVYPRLLGTGVPGARVSLIITSDLGDQASAEVTVGADGSWRYTPAQIRGTLTVTASQTYEKSGITYIENPIRLGTFNVGDGLRMTITETGPNESTLTISHFGAATKNFVGNARSSTLGMLVSKAAPGASGEIVVTLPYARDALGDVRFWQGDTSTGPYRVWKLLPASEQPPGSQ